MHALITRYKSKFLVFVAFCAMVLLSSCGKVYYDVPFINGYYHVDSYSINEIKECKVEGIDYIQIKFEPSGTSNVICYGDEGFDAISRRHNDNIRRIWSRPSNGDNFGSPENDLAKVYFEGQPLLTSHSFLTARSISTYVRTEQEFNYDNHKLSPFSKLEYDCEGMRPWHPVENYLNQLSPDDLLLMFFDYYGPPYAAIIYVPKEEISDDVLTLVLIDVHNQEFKLKVSLSEAL